MVVFHRQHHLECEFELNLLFVLWRIAWSQYWFNWCLLWWVCFSLFEHSGLLWYLRDIAPSFRWEGRLKYDFKEIGTPWWLRCLRERDLGLWSVAWFGIIWLRRDSEFLWLRCLWSWCWSYVLGPHPGRGNLGRPPSLRRWSRSSRRSDRRRRSCSYSHRNWPLFRNISKSNPWWSDWSARCPPRSPSPPKGSEGCSPPAAPRSESDIRGSKGSRWILNFVNNIISRSKPRCEDNLCCPLSEDYFVWNRKRPSYLIYRSLCSDELCSHHPSCPTSKYSHQLSYYFPSIISRAIPPPIVILVLIWIACISTLFIILVLLLTHSLVILLSYSRSSKLLSH